MLFLPWRNSEPSVRSKHSNFIECGINRGMYKTVWFPGSKVDFRIAKSFYCFCFFFNVLAIYFLSQSGRGNFPLFCIQSLLFIYIYIYIKNPELQLLQLCIHNYLSATTSDITPSHRFEYLQKKKKHNRGVTSASWQLETLSWSLHLNLQPVKHSQVNKGDIVQHTR